LPDQNLYNFSSPKISPALSMLTVVLCLRALQQQGNCSGKVSFVCCLLSYWIDIHIATSRGKKWSSTLFLKSVMRLRKWNLI